MKTESVLGARRGAGLARPRIGRRACGAAVRASSSRRLRHRDERSHRQGRQTHRQAFIVDPRVRARFRSPGSMSRRWTTRSLLAILTVHQFAAYESNGIVQDRARRGCPAIADSGHHRNSAEGARRRVRHGAVPGEKHVHRRTPCRCCVRSCRRPPTWRRIRRRNTLIIIRSRGECAPHRRHGRAARQGARRPDRSARGRCRTSDATRRSSYAGERVAGRRQTPRGLAILSRLADCAIRPANAGPVSCWRASSSRSSSSVHGLAEQLALAEAAMVAAQEIQVAERFRRLRRSRSS